MAWEREGSPVGLVSGTPENYSQYTVARRSPRLAIGRPGFNASFATTHLCDFRPAPPPFWASASPPVKKWARGGSWTRSQECPDSFLPGLPGSHGIDCRWGLGKDYIQFKSQFSLEEEHTRPPTQVKDG